MKVTGLLKVLLRINFYINAYHKSQYLKNQFRFQVLLSSEVTAAILFILDEYLIGKANFLTLLKLKKGRSIKEKGTR